MLDYCSAIQDLYFLFLLDFDSLPLICFAMISEIDFTDVVGHLYFWYSREIARFSLALVFASRSIYLSRASSILLSEEDSL
jgi:hypothetical protein